MNPIKAFAKIYGNYFLTVQGVKVMKTIKKDDNVVVGLGKLFIADKLMDTAPGGPQTTGGGGKILKKTRRKLPRELDQAARKSSGRWCQCGSSGDMART